MPYPWVPVAPIAMNTLGGFDPAARASAIAIVLYYLFGYYRIALSLPRDWWHMRGEIMTPN